VAAFPAAAHGQAWGPGRPQRLGRVVALAVVACLLGAGTFVAGEHHQSHALTIVTGQATVGDDIASIPLNGYTYGIAGVGSVTWIDSQGNEHLGSWPACLNSPGSAPWVKFGWVPATLPDGGTTRQVVWVDCVA